MDLKGIEVSGGEATVILRPSAENGLFFAKRFGDVAVGNEIRFVPRTHYQEVVDGKLEAVKKYIKPSLSRPGVYIIEGGSAWLESDYASYGLDGEVVEYEPVDAQLQSADDLSQVE